MMSDAGLMNAAYRASQVSLLPTTVTQPVKQHNQCRPHGHHCARCSRGGTRTPRLIEKCLAGERRCLVSSAFFSSSTAVRTRGAAPAWTGHGARTTHQIIAAALERDAQRGMGRASSGRARRKRIGARQASFLPLIDFLPKTLSHAMQQ